MINIPTFEEIEQFDYWVPPAPNYFQFNVITKLGEKVTIHLCPIDENAQLPGKEIRIGFYYNEQLIALEPNEKKSLRTLLLDLIDNDKLGHREGLGVLVAKEMIAYFDPDDE